MYPSLLRLRLARSLYSPLISQDPWFMARITRPLKASASLIHPVVLLILLSVGVALQATAQAENQKRILHPKGLLWKIDKPGHAPSHLYGTMHVGDPRVTRLAPEVEAAFSGAERFAMEMLLNFRAVSVITRASFFDDGRTLKSVMQADDYQRLMRLLNDTLRLPEDLVINMRPWAVLMAMMMPSDGQMSQDAALDMVLYRRAALRKIPLLGLETAEEQLAIFESLSLQEQIWLLNKSVDEFSQSGEQLYTMLDAYLDRDLEGLVLLQQQYMYADSDIDDRFMLELVDKRNLRMVRRMQDVLAQGNAFIAIGALHLPGENGVLHLLEQQGFTVTPVY
jgi:hypothetical protein